MIDLDHFEIFKHDMLLKFSKVLKFLIAITELPKMFRLPSIISPFEKMIKPFRPLKNLVGLASFENLKALFGRIVALIKPVLDWLHDIAVLIICDICNLP